jgi:hypothetical protein
MSLRFIAGVGTGTSLSSRTFCRGVEEFVIGVGGFLGIGEKSVALKMDRLEMTPNPEGDGLVLMMGANKEDQDGTGR